MTDKEQIIIDDVDANECKCYPVIAEGCEFFIDHDPPSEQGTWGGAIHKGACKIYSKDCKYNNNCHFKQLARKTQECEDLKLVLQQSKDNNKSTMLLLAEKNKECEELKEYIQEREVWGDHCEFCKHNDKENCHQNIILDNLKTINSYRKALEEIEEYVRDNSDFDKSDMLTSRTGAYYILDIINKAKDCQLKLLIFYTQIILQEAKVT